MKHAFLVLGLLITTASVASACSSDTPATPTNNVSDAGSGDASSDGKVEPVDIGSGTKWSDLYRDIFGPTNRPGSCVFKAGCHGSETSAGVTGGGIRCFDQKGCREGLIAANLIKQENVANPDSAPLFLVVRHRKANGEESGFMPKEPADFYFPAKSIDRMKTWIKDGFKDD
jgi:hypothetical protein